MNADTHRQCAKCMQIKPADEFRRQGRKISYQQKCNSCCKDMSGKTIIIVEDTTGFQIIGPNGAKNSHFRTMDEAVKFTENRWTNYELRIFKYGATS